VLEIHTNDEHEPFMFDGTTAELFRTVRVIGGQVVFVELSPGHLINTAHIERIVDDARPADCEGFEEPGHFPCERLRGHDGHHWGSVDGPVTENLKRLEEIEKQDPASYVEPAPLPARQGEVRATPIPGGPGSCRHGFIQGTCSQCNREWVGGVEPNVCRDCGTQHVGACVPEEAQASDPGFEDGGYFDSEASLLP
jgi:hypothetical protein